MANDFNIILGAKIDTASLTKNINDYFSQNTFKIKVEIDTAKMQSQIQSAVSSAMSKATGGSSGATGDTYSSVTPSGDLLSRSTTLSGDTLTVTEKRLKDLHTTLTEVTDAEGNIVKTTETFTTSLGGNAKKVSELTNTLEYLNRNGKITTEQFWEFDEKLKDIDVTAEDASARLTNFSKDLTSQVQENARAQREQASAISNSLNATDSFNAKVSSLRNNLEYLNHNGKITAEQFDKLSGQLNNITENTADVDNQFANLRKDISAATSATAKHTNILNSVDSAYEKVSSRIEDLTKQNLIGKDAAKDFKEQLDKAYSMKDTDPKQAAADIQKVNQAISDGKKQAMGFGEMLSTAYKKFANHQIATSYRNVC